LSDDAVSRAQGRGGPAGLVHRLKFWIVAATLVPVGFLGFGTWLAVAKAPSVTLGAWSRDLALLAALALLLGLVLLLACWMALRRIARELTTGQSAGRESIQRARAEQALYQAQKLEALGRLTGGVAHDFNNLLMVINNNAYLLRRMQEGAPVAPRIAAIERAVESGSKLTRQLLAFARRDVVNPELLRLQDELPALIDLMRPALGSRITIQSDLDPSTKPVCVDRAGLELALLNLAVNAGDAMPERGQVEVRLRNARPGEAPGLQGEFVVISISDSGVGIPEDIQDRVFEPFFSTKPEGKGTGLGLSQVYGFCQQSGGAVTLESKEGQGTTVRLYLAASAEQARKKEASAPAAPSEELRQRVLIVEDNDEVAETTRQLLEFLGCMVKRVSSGNAAVMRLERDSQAFDLVLSDIVMPGGLSGIEVMHYVRDRHPHLPIVLMTGYSNELQKLSSEDIVLLKPFSPQELAQALRRALARHLKASA
jgi:signal transduction histidine kinase